MARKLLIKGGKKLSGTVTPIANKNAIVAALPASILSTSDCVFHNVPNTSDVTKILQLLESLGALVTNDNNGTVTINCKDIALSNLDDNLASSFRASILFAGPLLARFGEAKIALPGGCVLGARSIAAHIDSFRKVGVDVTLEGDYAYFKVGNTQNSTKESLAVWQNEASVTATENVAMYLAFSELVKSKNVTVLNAACEPHVTQLLQFLNDLGANINGLGSNRLEFTQPTNVQFETTKSQENNTKASTVDPQKKEIHFTPEPDFVDIAGYIVAAAITRGNITLKGANNFYISGGLIETFEKFNISIKGVGEDLVVDGSKDLEIDIETSGFPLAGPSLPKLKPAPWPGFPVDVIPVMATLACKTRGELLLQNWMYETGLDFVRELNKMGADIFYSDPQRVIIKGPVQFKGGSIYSPGIIQACKAIFLAALADDVETTLDGAHVLNRRYPDIVSVYKSLGADITILEE